MKTEAGETTIALRMADVGDAGPLAELMLQLGYPTREDEMALRLRRIIR